MSRATLSPEARAKRDRFLAALPSAARTALRTGARNTVGLDHKELRTLGEDGLMAAEALFDPSLGVELETFAYSFVRGAVLHAIRARRRVAAREIPADTAQALRRAGDRRVLEDLGAGTDDDDYAMFEDTAEDFGRDAQEYADDSMLAVILGRAARSPAAMEKLLIKRELLERLEATVESLPPAQARLVRMRFYQEKTLKEISAATGVAISTLYDQIAGALRELARRLRSSSR